MRDPLFSKKEAITGSIRVAGRSTGDGRMSTLLRIRPTLMQRVKNAAGSGAFYLIVERALEELLERAEAGDDIMIDADDMYPSTEDHDLLATATEEALAKRKAKKHADGDDGGRSGPDA